MLTQGLAAPVFPIALFQLYLVKTKCCNLVILLRKDKLYSKCTHDLLFKGLVLVFCGLYLLISQEIQIWYWELSEQGWELMGALAQQQEGSLPAGSLRSSECAGSGSPVHCTSLISASLLSQK